LVNLVMTAVGTVLLIAYGLPAAGSVVFAGSFLAVGVSGAVVFSVAASWCRTPAQHAVWRSSVSPSCSRCAPSATPTSRGCRG